MKLFIGATVSAEFQKAAAAVIADLAASGADARWSKPENLHLTLLFIGEAEPARLESLRSVVGAAAAERSGIELSFEGLGAFPSWTRPRSLWIGLGEGAPALGVVAGRLRALLPGPKAFPNAEREREFKAHLTIGRVRGGGFKALQEKVAAWNAPGRLVLPRVRVERLALYESRPTPGGSSYNELFAALFRA